MNKQEFIDRLRAALNGRIPQASVEENVNYYQDYINTEMRKGKTEEEVLELLGDPRLIARTIIQTTPGAAQGADFEYESSGRDSRAYGDQEAYREQQGNSWFFRMPRWLLVLIVALIVLVVLSVVFSILSFLAPFIVVMAAVVFFVKLFRDWLN